VSLQPIIVAQKCVAGNLHQTSKAGFEIIASYVFGNTNLGATINNKISITTPVICSFKPKVRYKARYLLGMCANITHCKDRSIFSSVCPPRGVIPLIS